MGIWNFKFGSGNAECGKAERKGHSAWRVGHGAWRQVQRIRLRSSVYDPTRHRGTQRSKDRGQKTEDRGQRTEDGYWN